MTNNNKENKEMAEVNKDLQLIINEQNVAQENAKQLIAAFGAPFTEAGDILRTYKDIKVTDATQVNEMQQAREARLTLKNIRTGVERTRKELKEDALKTGKAIDSVARYIKENIQPAEEYLELQEKFVEIKQAAELEKKRNARLEELTKYGGDPAIYNLNALTDEQFNNVVATLKADREREQAEAKAEQDRIAKEQADREAEAERMRIENAKLKAEAEAKEKADREEREKREAEQRKADEAERAEYQRVSSIVVDLKDFAHSVHTVEDCRKKYAALEQYVTKLNAHDAANDRVIAAASQSKIELKDMAEYIKDREAKAEADRKAAEEAKAKQEAEAAEAKALLAPDKEKLLKFAVQLADLLQQAPSMQSNQSQQVLNTAIADGSRVVNTLRESADKL